MAKQKEQKPADPFPYDGPIARADGVRPYNHYLWPTESWWPNREIGYHIDGRWFFGIVALADGRFSTEGSVFLIERDGSRSGRPCVFITRSTAIRTAAARMIRSARQSRHWEGLSHGGLRGHLLADLINWALQIVARETGKPAPKLIVFSEAEPHRAKTGLPLFDLDLA